jgi:hypothetical protein
MCGFTSASSRVAHAARYSMRQVSVEWVLTSGPCSPACQESV